jgi:hypothetical protein
VLQHYILNNHGHHTQISKDLLIRKQRMIYEYFSKNLRQKIIHNTGQPIRQVLQVASANSATKSMSALTNTYVEDDIMLA